MPGHGQNGTHASGAIARLGAAARTLAAARRFDFRAKVVLVTGGSRGLGLVLARELVREGARVALLARDPDELERARAELAGKGAEVLTVTCDVTDSSQIDLAVREVRGRMGAIDVLVNNAGVIQTGPMDVMTRSDYEDAMRTHFWAPLELALAVLPEMRARGAGRIVNISSIGGKISVPHLLPYSASKFALTGLSEGLRAELLADNVLVTTVCPGLMRTGSPRNALFKGRHREEHAWFSISSSLPVVSTSAERAARAILRACRQGRAELVLTPPALLATWAHGLFPGLVANVLGLVGTLLPPPGGIGTASARGADSESPLSPSTLTVLSDEAAARNNELGPK